MAVSILALILLCMAVAAGVAIVTVLMGNRHTQGATRAVVIFALIAVGLVVMWRFAAMPTPAEDAATNPYQQQQQSMLETQAKYFDELANSYEQQGGTQNQHFAQQFREQAELTRSQIHDASSYSVSSTHTKSRAFFLFSPVILIVFLAIVFMLFKHAGPAVGVAAIALPLVVMFFGYFSMERRSSHQAYNQPQLSSTPNSFVSEMPIPKGEIVVVNEGSLTATSKSPPSNARVEAQPAVAEVEDAAEFASLASVTADAVATEDTEAVDEPIDAEPTPGTPAELLPDWVRQPPKSAGNVHRRVLESSWYGTTDECLHKLESGPIEAAIIEHMHELATEDSTQTNIYIPTLRTLGINKRYIRENVIKEEFYESGDFEHQADMKNLHMLLEFDSRTSDDLLARWRKYTRQGTVEAVAVGMGGVLVCLAGVLGLIKLDTFTKGYYTKRLFIGVPAAIIGIVILLAATGEWWDGFFL